MPGGVKNASLYASRLVEAHRRSIGILAAIVALAVAAVYLVVVPQEAAAAPWAAQVVLRYGHSVCWVLLAVVAGLFAAASPPRVVARFAYAALACYVVFNATLFMVKGI